MYKQSFLDKHFESILGTMFLVLIFFAFVGAPLSFWYSSGIEQKAINKECGTNYSQVDILFSGDTLKQLCQIKKQEVLINQGLTNSQN